jgi:hypothetical protein
MMWIIAVWFTAMSAVPEGVDIDDVDMWADAAESFREGPDGCWMFEGHVTMILAVDGGASSLGLGGMMAGEVHGRVQARFDDHTWTQFHYTLDQDREPWMVLRPMWGSVAEDAIAAVDEDGIPLPDVGPSDEERERMRRRARMFSMRGNRGDDEPAIQMSTVEYVDWNEERREVQLVQDVFVEGMGQGEASAVHHFPDGEPFVTAVDITLPKTVTLGRWPLQGKIRRAGVHLRGHRVGDAVLPTAQRFSAIAGFFGQTFSADSSLYFERAQRCVSTPVTEQAVGDRTTDDPSGPDTISDDPDEDLRAPSASEPPTDGS